MALKEIPFLLIHSSSETYFLSSPTINIWGCTVSIYESMRVLVTQLCLFVTPWTIAHQAPLLMEFSRQEYWSGLPFPSPSIYELGTIIIFILWRGEIEVGNLT